MLQPQPVFMFANQAGLDMLETTLVALQDITLEKIFDESGRKALCSDFAKLMQQVKKQKEKNLQKNIFDSLSENCLASTGICLFAFRNMCVDDGKTCEL